MSAIEYRELDAILHPRSLAIIGASASEDPSVIAAMPLRFALQGGYRGKLYPVNPKRQEIRGIKCFPSVLDIPGEVDDALIMLPAPAVAGALRQCAQKKVKAAIVCSGGFAELGGEGKKLQLEMESICRETGIRVVGPNCTGMRNVLDHITLGFSLEQQLAIPGRLGVAAQSGGIMNSVVARFAKTGVGMSYSVNVGNQVDLEVCDFARFFVEDRNTDVIALYIEGLKNPKKFLEVAESAFQKEKPLVVWKTGSSEMGAKAVRSHTAALAGSDAVFDAICRQKHITRVDDYDTFTACVDAFLNCRIPKGNRLGLMAGSGGITAAFVDRLSGLTLTIPQLTAETQEEAKKILPGYPGTGELTNPFDVSASTILEKRDILKEVTRLFASDSNVDIVVMTMSMLEEQNNQYAIEALTAAQEATSKPILVFATSGELRAKETTALRAKKIPVMSDTREAVCAVDSLISYGEALRRAKVGATRPPPTIETDAREIRDRLRLLAGKALSEKESMDLLSRYGIGIPREAVAKSPEEAAQAAKGIGYPVVMKINSPDITHNTEAGTIKLGIDNQTELLQAYEEILSNARRHKANASIQGVLVQEMVEGGREVIVGVSQDAEFGPTLTFGLGGVFVEALKDVSNRVAPITREDAEQMISEIKGRKVLGRFRGRPQANLDGIVDTLLRLSRLATDLADFIAEVDINPLIVSDEGKEVKAADALVILR